MEIINNICGWIGTFLILLAYYLVSNKKISGTSNSYQIINLVGAIGIGINVYHHKAWPSLALEIVWALIAVAALIKHRQEI